MNFLKRQNVSCIAVHKGTESSQISSKMPLFVFRRWKSYGFERHDWIFIFGWTIPL